MIIASPINIYMYIFVYTYEECEQMLNYNTV